MKHTPVSTRPSSSQRHRRIGSSSDKDTPSSPMQEKPMPSYLRPTISSSKASVKQHPRYGSPTKKTAPMDKASSSISPRKASPSVSPRKFPSSIMNRTTNVKATPTSRANARNLARGTYRATTRKQEGKAMAPKEKVLLVGVGRKTISIGSGDNEETSEGETSLHYDASEESACGWDDLVTSEEGDSRMHSRMHSRDYDGCPPGAYNMIVEETMIKLRERRMMDLALAANSETVISLREPECQQIPWKEGNQTGQPEDEPKVKGVEIGQDSQYAKSDQTGQPEVEPKVKDAEIGQDSQYAKSGQTGQPEVEPKVKGAEIDQDSQYAKSGQTGQQNHNEAKNLEQVLTAPIDVQEKVTKQIKDGEIGQKSQQAVNSQTGQHIIKEGENNPIDVEEKVEKELIKLTKDSTNAIEEEKLTEPIEKSIAPTEEKHNAGEVKIE